MWKSSQLHQQVFAHNMSLLSNMTYSEKGAYNITCQGVLLIFATHISFATSKIDEKAGGFSVITKHCYVTTATPLTVYNFKHMRVVEI
jgi:hypothetical protein